MVLYIPVWIDLKAKSLNVEKGTENFTFQYG